MNENYPQEYCYVCYHPMDGIELDEPEILFYGDDEIMVQKAIVYCENCREYKIVYLSD